MAVSFDKVDYILNAFNNFHPKLQFTLEFGGKKINFLDTTIILDQNRVKMIGITNQRFPVEFLITGLSIRCLKKGALLWGS